MFHLSSHIVIYLKNYFTFSTNNKKRVHNNWQRQTDREPTDREQRRSAEKGDPKYIFTIPRAIYLAQTLTLWRNHCDKITDENM